MTSKITVAAIAASVAFAASAAWADSNIIPGNWTKIVPTGTYGTLPAGNVWLGGAYAPASLTEPVSGSPFPDGTQWNAGTFWWDANDYGASTWTVYLNHNYKIDEFVVQADDNDNYLLQYWNGSSWATAYDVPYGCCWGLDTRDSGIIAPITTNALRFSALAGDGYYALGQVEAFGIVVPEPSTWAMVLAGFALLSYAGYRGRRLGVAAAPI